MLSKVVLESGYETETLTVLDEFSVMQCRAKDQTLFIFNLHTLHKAELGLVGEVSFSMICIREKVW